MVKGLLLLAMSVLAAGVSCTRQAGDYLAMGKAAFVAGKYDEASLNYRKALAAMLGPA